MGRIGNIKKTRMEEKQKEVIQPLQFLSRSDYLVSLIVCTLTFCVYAFTAAPGVTLADSADFMSGVLTLGIVHAPGYPLYTVLGHLFSLLPFGEPAFRVNLFSAVWGSLCLGIVFLTLRMLFIERIHAVFATLLLGFTTVFWSKTAVAEVYTFHAFLLACIVFWILSYNRDKKRSQLYLIFLTTGLALSNHYPLVILTGLGLVFLLDRRHLHATDFVKGLMFLGLGLTPYLYLFIQASNLELQYNFDKISDFGMVVDHIFRQRYPNAAGGTLWDKPLLAFRFLKELITNFWLSSFFLFSGIACAFLEQWKYRYALLIAALSPSLGLILILTFDSSEHHWIMLLAYLIPSFLFLSFFLALGLQTVMDRYVRNNILQVSLLIIILLSQVGLNFNSSSHHNDKLAELWGAELLNSLKPDSILMLCGGPGDVPLYYLQLVKGLRQDVTLYNRWPLVIDNKEKGLSPSYRANLTHRRQLRKTQEQQLINNSLQPIYYTCSQRPAEQQFTASLTPFVYRADKRHFEASDYTQFTVSDALLDSLVNGYPKSEYWLDNLRLIIFGRLISYYGGLGRTEVDSILKHFNKTKLSSDPHLSLGVASNLHYFEKYHLARTFYERAEQLSLEAFSSRDLAVYCNVLGNAGNYEKALPICMKQEQSSAPCEYTTGQTQETIINIYKAQRNWRKVAEYARKILQCRPDHKIAQSYLKMATERGK